MTPAEVIGIIIGGISLLFNGIQFIRDRHNKEMLKKFEENLNLAYTRSSALVTSCGNAIKNDPNSFEKSVGFIGQAKGQAEEIFNKTINDIVTYYNLDKTKLDSWVADNKIHPSHKDIFMKYVKK